MAEKSRRILSLRPSKPIHLSHTRPKQTLIRGSVCTPRTVAAANYVHFNLFTAGDLKVFLLCYSTSLRTLTNSVAHPVGGTSCGILPPQHIAACHSTPFTSRNLGALQVEAFDGLADV